MSSSWKSIPLREDAELLRKEVYHYQLGGDLFQIELFETQGSEFYAIGTPSHSDRLYIYGSTVVKDPAVALEQAIKKINREHDHTEIQFVGEDVHSQEE
ncbi:hypothetical protein [Sulfoacidibacillus thermotolerans]|uniref:Uncharacterized protein n=1 Tax=Sulfoacidibacillus thermotolerans TaxID=1765684 RepID=A0A2U3DCF4_SULT2|nr:hypothetical protein [Sulfoacidibacillus thermotolerans]PWI58925.1 hypothetical protein BM613_02275 [Sulfoacidibacillus thermotolerans]